MTLLASVREPHFSPRSQWRSRSRPLRFGRIAVRGRHHRQGDNNAVINGWDFSGNGGYEVNIDSNNVTIENCYFAVGSNAQPLLRVGYGVTTDNVTIINNVFDGEGVNNNWPWSYLLSSNITWLENAYYQFIQSSPAPTGTST